MEEKFLIDTNIIIYFLDGKIPESQKEKVRHIFENSFTVSAITNIEVLGWHKLTEKDRNNIKRFLSNAYVMYLDAAVEEKAIEIKQNHNIETPDCIIGATAILNHLTLVTRNNSDFRKIRELKIYNPFEN